MPTSAWPSSRDPDAEALELAVADVAGGVAGLERAHAGVGEIDSGHSRSPGCGCSRGTEGQPDPSECNK